MLKFRYQPQRRGQASHAMKIEGTGQLHGNRPAQRARPTGSGDRFSTHLDDGPADSAPTAASAPMTSVAALLAVQDEGDATSRRRRRALQRGGDLLDRLDEIRHALLAGNISPSRLQALADTLTRDRQAIDDPALAEVLAQIELRCAVELAKQGIAAIPG